MKYIKECLIVFLTLVITSCSGSSKEISALQETNTDLNNQRLSLESTTTSLASEYETFKSTAVIVEKQIPVLQVTASAQANEISTAKETQAANQIKIKSLEMKNLSLSEELSSVLATSTLVYNDLSNLESTKNAIDESFVALQTTSTALVEEYREIIDDKERKAALYATQVYELENGATSLISQIRINNENKEFKKVIELTEKLHSKFAGSPEDIEGQELAKKAQIEVDKIELAEKTQKEKEEREKKAKLDAAVYKLNKKPNEYSGITFYHDKNEPYYADVNYIYAYLGTEEGYEPWLRLKIQYGSNGYLYIDSYGFNIDGKRQTIDFDKEYCTRYDNNYRAWEVCDFPITQKEVNLISAIINSEKTIMRYEGINFSKDREISKIEKVGLENILVAYKALDGSLNYDF